MRSNYEYILPSSELPEGRIGRAYPRSEGRVSERLGPLNRHILEALTGLAVIGLAESTTDTVEAPGPYDDQTKYNDGREGTENHDNDT